MSHNARTVATDVTQCTHRCHRCHTMHAPLPQMSHNARTVATDEGRKRIREMVAIILYQVVVARPEL